MAKGNRRILRSTQQAGGRAAAEKYAPLFPCPRCGKEYPVGTSWMAWLGHLGLHSLADKFFNGDLQAAQRRLQENGRARQEEGATWQNGAFKPYRPVTKKDGR